MTKKHYEAIADCIEFRLCAADNHPHRIAKRLADYFTTDNPRFDRARFLQACGIEQPVYKKCRHGVFTGGELSPCRQCRDIERNKTSQT